MKAIFSVYLIHYEETNDTEKQPDETIIFLSKQVTTMHLRFSRCYYFIYSLFFNESINLHSALP